MAARQKMSPELKFAIETITKAGEIALKYFGSNVTIDLKENDSPVTKADLESEELIRTRLQKEYPNHGMIGEEFGDTNSDSEYVWLIDPIDGTKSFIHGVPLFGMLLGLQKNGIPILGVAHFPALNQTAYAEIGGGAFLNGSPAKVSTVSDLSNALMVSGSMSSMLETDKMSGYLVLSMQVAMTRTWGDAYGHIMVATGRAEFMLDPVVKPWDTCALMPIILEAGGSFTDFSGKQTHVAGNAISTNSLLLETVLSNFQ